MSLDKVKEFNNIVITLLNQLLPFTGVIYKKKFEMIIETNAILPLEQFLVHALPLRDQILNRDEAYFTNEKIYTDSDQNTLIQILQLKDIYYKLDENSRSSICDYFQAMLILSEEYIKNKNKN